MSRPTLVVVVAGTGTDVGKTFVATAVLRGLAARGLRVSVRKPAQSGGPDEPETDADRLAAATGERPEAVCAPHRWYRVAMAPPMAASKLGLPVPRLADLVGEVESGWPAGTDVGVVEGIGGVASPLAVDGDTADLSRALAAELTVLVSDAGLGAINSVRLGCRAITSGRVVVHLNRYDPGVDLHRSNRAWLVEQDGLTVTTDVADLVATVAAQPRHAIPG